MVKITMSCSNKCGKLAELRCPKCVAAYCSMRCFDLSRHVSRCPAHIERCRDVFDLKKTCHNIMCDNPNKCAQRCKNCYGVYYCSPACQKEDWSDHKPFCTDFHRGFNYFKIHYPHIMVEHFYDIRTYGHSVNESIREFTPTHYEKFTPAKFAKEKKLSRREVRDITNTLKKGVHIYIFRDAAKAMDLTCMVAPNVNDNVLYDEAGTEISILDQVD